MKVVRIVLTLLVAALFATLTMAGEKTPPKAKPQTTCPITGSPINRTFYEDFEGKRVYFCCGDCPATFKKDPKKYIKQLEDQGVTLEKRQTLCPVMGEKINKKYFEDYEGKRVYFCCGDCPKEFKKDPAKYIKKLQEQGITLDETPSGKAKAEEKPHEGGGKEGHNHHNH